MSRTSSTKAKATYANIVLNGFVRREAEYYAPDRFFVARATFFSALSASRKLNKRFRKTFYCPLASLCPEPHRMWVLLR